MDSFEREMLADVLNYMGKKELNNRDMLAGYRMAIKEIRQQIRRKRRECARQRLIRCGTSEDSQSGQQGLGPSIENLGD